MDRGRNACGSPHVYEDVGEVTWIHVHVVAPGIYARACGHGCSGRRPGSI
jgi:hypothetical protein